MRFSSQLVSLLVVVSLVVAWFAPQAGARFLEPIEQFGAHLANRKLLTIVVVGIAPALIRVCLLGIWPVPIPIVHDEFSYLLAADTIAHGRLTNPPHPMWIYFETMHVNQHPTYMSKYPPAQGAILAVGQLLGNPWIGIVLSVALMCGAIVWMLQGWLPPQWALVGGILASSRLGVSGYWMNSYWGGAVAAIGGALVVGAVPRIMRFHRGQDAAFLGLGAGILANSRPFEGIIFCVPVFVTIMIWLCGHRSPPWRETAPRIILPVFAVLALTVIFMGYYNWRGTGDPLLFPYTLNSRTYMSAPELIWEKGKAPLRYFNPQFESFYTTGWSRQTAFAGKANSIPKALRVVWSDVRIYGRFFLWVELCVPLLALPWVLTDRRVRFLVFQFGFCLLAFLLVDWFQPHYAAPLTAGTFALLTQGMRHLRRWRWINRTTGIGLTRVIVLCALVLAPFHRFYLDVQPQLVNRSRVETQLTAMPGNHLVVVRYSSQHNPLLEWVYNRADIDRARVVWAREIPGVSLEPLLNYYRGRDVWLVEADSPTPDPVPYDLSLHDR